MGEVTIRGQVQTLETRDIRNNKTIIMMEVTDFTDTIVIKIFAQTEQVPEILKRYQNRCVSENPRRDDNRPV